MRSPTTAVHLPDVAAAQSPTVRIHFHPEKQNAEAIRSIVDQILHLAGCGMCGRVAFLHPEYLVDPAESLRVNGAVISVTATNVAAIQARG